MANSDADLSSLRIDRSSHGVSSPRKSRKTGKLVLWAVVIAAIVGGIIVVKQWLSPAVEVQLATASLTSPSQANAVLTASGYVVARRKAAVASKGTGRLVFLGVEEGDKVKKGQVIARLEDDDVIASRERARENVRVAEADLYEAQKNLERMRTLVKQEMIAQAEYDIAEARYKRVVSMIDAAKFALREAVVAVDNTRIIAPFDGTVLKKNADVGEIYRRYVVAGSRRGCFRGEHHAGRFAAELRDHFRRIPAAPLSGLRQQYRTDGGSRQSDSDGEDQIQRIRPARVARDGRENYLPHARLQRGSGQR